MAKLIALCCFVAVILAVADAQRGPPRNRSTTARPSTTPGPNTPSPSIILGEPAAEGEFPFHALLFSARDGELTGWDCGGSLIHPNWVLTAAHCLPDTDSTRVELGSVDRYGMTYSSWSSQRFIHESYNMRGPESDDIALIKLSEPASGPNIAVVEMASPSQGNLDGEIVRATGFGVTDDNTGDDSDVLLKVELRTITLQDCNSRGFQTSENQMCTVWSTQVGQNHCEGDSGGPISYPDPSGTTYLVGVASYGTDQGCAADVPSVNTRVSQYRDWIQRIMDENP